MAPHVLLIEQGAIETRAALLRDGGAVRFWFGPAIGEEQRDQRPTAGRTFTGCVRRVDKALSAAFIDIGAAQDAFLIIRKSNAAAITEGAWLQLRVLSAPRRMKGAVVEFLGPTENDAPPGRFDLLPAPLEAIDALGAAGTQIVTDGSENLRVLKARNVDARMMQNTEAPNLFAAYRVDQALADALEERVALPGGGALHFFESEALVAIDVDTGAAGASSSDRLREKVVADAAREAALQIERRNLAGRIVIDFPSIRSRDVRGRAVKEIEGALFHLPRITSSTIAGSNFVTLTRERRGASLWDETTQAAPADPVPGRRFTLFWLARGAIREAERRQRTAPNVRLVLYLGKALEDYFREMEKPAEAYFLRFGARLEIAGASQLGDRTFEIIER